MNTIKSIKLIAIAAASITFIMTPQNNNAAHSVLGPGHGAVIFLVIAGVTEKPMRPIRKVYRAIKTILQTARPIAYTD